MKKSLGRESVPGVASGTTAQLQMLWPKERVRMPPEVEVPPGYRLRTFRLNDMIPYVRLMRMVGFHTFDRKFVLGFRYKVTPGGFFVIEHERTHRIVASAMATHNPTDRHLSGGELGWVAADPRHKGRGLGRAVCAAAVGHFLRCGYRRIYLKTDDWRLPAIKVYLVMGFRPLLCAGDMAKRWRAVCRNLGTPFESVGEGVMGWRTSPASPKLKRRRGQIKGACGQRKGDPSGQTKGEGEP